MSCNQNEECLNLYKYKYPMYKEEIDSNFNSINEKVIEVVDTLKSLDIPDDYLGNKIKDKLEELYVNFNNELDELNVSKNDIDKFIDDKIIEHQGHYMTWKQKQLALSKGGDTKYEQ